MADDAATQAELRKQIQRRRSFAIISHPDAGKTTLTERLLLYSGMIRTAGIVGGRKGRAAAASDWMEMEQERGISITASAMQFPYKDIIVNVLDTPGHQDFSEDTYRTLTAADSVIMVIDCAKGVEAQTRKLFEACRLRRIPVLTFVNKMDLHGREPLDLMAEVEEVLGIQASARNWPIGSGPEFCGVYDRDSRDCVLFTATASGGAKKPEIERVPLAEAEQHPRLGPERTSRLRDEIELLDEAGNPYSHEAYLDCQVTPVFFGSALTSFGIELLYDSFVDLAPSPGARKAFEPDGTEITIDPDTQNFSAFVFKLQANMNKRHHDCVAFLRVNSGRYRREMQVKHQGTGKKFAMPSPHSLVVNERSTLQEAFPGDVIGVINKGQFAIGDTISEKGSFVYEELPKFQPELFARLRPKDLGKQKPFARGTDQLVAEGAIQMLREWDNRQGPPIFAAVGQLQFEVMQHRLEAEYGVAVDIEMLPFASSAWIKGDLATFKPSFSARIVADLQERPMVLFANEWDKNYTQRENPDHELLDFA